MSMEFDVYTVKVLHALEKRNNIQTIEKNSKRNQNKKKKQQQKQKDCTITNDKNRNKLRYMSQQIISQTKTQNKRH